MSAMPHGLLSDVAPPPPPPSLVDFTPAMPAPLVGPGGHPAGPVEDLEWRTPDCPEGCGETEYDGDTLWCDKCGATWERDGTGGVRHAVEPADVAA